MYEINCALDSLLLKRSGDTGLVFEFRGCQTNKYADTASIATRDLVSLRSPIANRQSPSKVEHSLINGITYHCLTGPVTSRS